MRNQNNGGKSSKKINWWRLVFDVVKVIIGFFAGASL